MLDDVKRALKVKTTYYDDELSGYIESAKQDLARVGVLFFSDGDSLIKTAVITYCRYHFGSPEDYERLKLSYEEQRAALSSSTGYTEWGE